MELFHVLIMEVTEYTAVCNCQNSQSDTPKEARFYSM